MYYRKNRTDPTLEHELYNTETKEVEDYETISVADACLRNKVLRSEGKPQRWLTVREGS